MPRWLAIGTCQGWDDKERFGQELHETHSWRPDARTTITRVYALDDGKLLAECHAVNQEAFQQWLNQKGWQVESIIPIKHIAQTGSIWDGQRP